MWNFLWIWLIVWANITFQWLEQQCVVSWQRVSRKGSEGAVSQMLTLLLGYLIYLWLQKQCAKRAAVRGSATVPCVLPVYNREPRPALTWKCQGLLRIASCQDWQNVHGLANYFAYAKAGWRRKGKNAWMLQALRKTASPCSYGF